VNDCASKENKGLYNSLLLALDLSSPCTGNLLAVYVIPATSTTFLYILFTSIVFVMIFYFMLTPEPEALSDDEKYTKEEQVEKKKMKEKE
jgi:short subunit fatty acids transporter